MTARTGAIRQPTSNWPRSVLNADGTHYPTHTVLCCMKSPDSYIWHIHRQNVGVKIPVLSVAVRPLKNFRHGPYNFSWTLKNSGAFCLLS